MYWGGQGFGLARPLWGLGIPPAQALGSPQPGSLFLLATGTWCRALVKAAAPLFLLI